MSKPIKSWPELRERLQALTSERGAKAALARQFNITNSAVSEWMRGLSMPSADITIRLLPWVAAEEAKQKQSGVADSTATPPKTQSTGHHTNEAQRKGRKKQ